MKVNLLPLLHLSLLIIWWCKNQKCIDPHRRLNSKRVIPLSFLITNTHFVLFVLMVSLHFKIKYLEIGNYLLNHVLWITICYIRNRARYFDNDWTKLLDLIRLRRFFVSSNRFKNHFPILNRLQPIVQTDFLWSAKKTNIV